MTTEANNKSKQGQQTPLRSNQTQKRYEHIPIMHNVNAQIKFKSNKISNRQTGKVTKGKLKQIDFLLKISRLNQGKLEHK